jgi:hypothetical protein
MLGSSKALLIKKRSYSIDTADDICESEARYPMYESKSQSYEERYSQVASSYPCGDVISRIIGVIFALRKKKHEREDDIGPYKLE